MSEARPPSTRRATSHGDAVGRSLALIAERLGSSLRTTSFVAMGATTETYRVLLHDGRVIAAQRFVGRGAARRAASAATLGPRLTAAGVAAPSLASVIRVGRSTWLASHWVDGESGRDWLDDTTRSRRLAVEMGTLAARLAAVDATGLELDPGWETAARLAQRTASWLRRLRGTLGSDDVRDLGRAVDTVHAAFAGVEPVFAHGDLAPVNVILAPDGALRAVIDLGSARLSVPHLDVAWWGWIVRFHHPDAWARTWPIFLAAAGVSADRETAAAIGAMQRLRCLEMAASTDDPAVRAAWLARLGATLGWRG